MQMWAYAAAAVTERRMRAKDKEVVCSDPPKSKENSFHFLNIMFYKI